MFQNLDPEILRDRYAVYVDDLSISGKTAQDIFDNVEGVANVRVDEDIAGGFITLRNVASVVCIALIAILLLVSSSSSRIPSSSRHSTAATRSPL